MMQVCEPWLVRGRYFTIAAAAAFTACTLLTPLDDLRGNDASDVAIDTATDAGADAPSDVSADAPVEAGFSPTSIAGLELWLSADFGANAVDGGLSTWTDRSPKSYTVSSNDASCSAPSLLTNSLHGLPAWSFNPYFANCFAVSSGFSDFTNGLAIFVVAQPQDCNSSFIGNASGFLDMAPDDTTTNGEVWLGRNPTPGNTTSGDFRIASEVTNGTGNVTADGGTTWVNGITHVYEAVLPQSPENASTSGYLYLDGNAVTAVNNFMTTPKNVTRTSNFVGYVAGSSGYRSYCGLIGEIILYAKVLNDNDRAAIETYLKAKWGL